MQRATSWPSIRRWAPPPSCALVADIHARGMRVMFDWTLNRASCDNVLSANHRAWFTRDAGKRICYAVPNRAYFAGFDFTNHELRTWLLEAMQAWVTGFDLDGMRFDDSDLTPLDFFDEIRAALLAVRPDIGIISQSTDELHHLDACDLTYDGGARDTMLRVARATPRPTRCAGNGKSRPTPFPAARGACAGSKRRSRAGRSTFSVRRCTWPQPRS